MKRGVELSNRLQTSMPRTSVSGWKGRNSPVIWHAPVRRALPGEEVLVRATAAGPNPIRSLRLKAHSTDFQAELPFKPTGSFTFATRIPGQQVKAGTLRYHLEATDTAGKAVRLPQDSGYFSIIVTQDEQPPEVVHQAITQGLPGQPLRITARVQDPSGVRWVRLRYRNVSQFEDYQTLSMEPTGEGDLYAGTLPGEALSPKWDLMYFFEVMDECGNGQIYPDLDKETPYIIVRLGSPAEHSEAGN